MLLQQVALQDFRNVPLARLEFEGRRHFLVGGNGQGKTSVLEAIGMLTALRSFRVSETGHLIRQGMREAAIGVTLDHESFGATSVTIRLGQEGKEVVVDSERIVRISDFIGRFPTVVFSSQDQTLVRGSPAGRRRWLDLALSAVRGDYLAALQGYHRALAARNLLLKREGGADSELSAFERTMAPAAVAVGAMRAGGLAELSALLKRHYAAIALAPESVEFAYSPDCHEATAETLLELWGSQRERDRQWRTTCRGPHRDDFEFLLDGRPARGFASEGQQRLLVVALRLAQAEWIGLRTPAEPVILADDVLGELDPDRRARFWSAISPSAQVIATGTSMPEGMAGAGWQLFHVSAGGVAEEKHR